MSYQLPTIEKLKGTENYDAWNVVVRAYLEDQDLWESVSSESDDKKKETKTRLEIILLIDPMLHIHFHETKAAKEAWENLAKAFEDTGLTRKVGLLRTSISTRLEDCPSVEEYVNKVIQTAYKLNCIDMKVSDEWVGAIL
ncbi:hypothetical protein JTB14_009804 [Gonioctena quinquepunctata]|nr:hypothetical protein JTB14_009804 [Gonioctena quinquepunctata]